MSESDFDELFQKLRTRTRDDLSLGVAISLLEAAHGATRSLVVDARMRCDACEGDGGAPGATRVACTRCEGKGKTIEMQSGYRIEKRCTECRGEGARWSATCASCSGRGDVARKQSLSLTIPPGTTTGTKLELAGRERGVSVATVTVSPHATLVRDGDHLRARVRFDAARAAIGGTLIVPWLEGAAHVPMPAGSHAGDELRLPGWGCVKLGAAYAPPSRDGDPYRTATTRGDLVVTLVDERSLASAYRVFGLDVGANRSDVDREYRRLVIALDPQRHPENANAPRAFARLEEAYAQITSVTSGAEPASVPNRFRPVPIVVGVLAAAAVAAYLLLR